MSQPTASIAGAHDFHGVAALFDEIDFAFGIDDKRDAVGYSYLGNVNTVSLGDFTIEKIAQQWEREL